jgi:hypothetical protein
MLEKYKIPLYLLGCILILVLVGWIANSYPRKSVLDDFIAKERIKIYQEYKYDIKAKDEKIKILNDKILVSEKILSDMVIAAKKLEAKKKNVQKPITNKETMDRFNKLGYPVIK